MIMKDSQKIIALSSAALDLVLRVIAWPYTSRQINKSALIIDHLF
jgi:hypothetical protein